MSAAARQEKKGHTMNQAIVSNFLVMNRVARARRRRESVGGKSKWVNRRRLEDRSKHRHLGVSFTNPTSPWSVIVNKARARVNQEDDSLHAFSIRVLVCFLL